MRCRNITMCIREPHTKSRSHNPEMITSKHDNDCKAGVLQGKVTTKQKHTRHGKLYKACVRCEHMHQTTVLHGLHMMRVHRKFTTATRQHGNTLSSWLTPHHNTYSELLMEKSGIFGHELSRATLQIARACLII